MVGLEVDELSLNANGIPKIKAIIRKIEFKKAQQFAQYVLTLKTAQEVREAAAQFFTV